MEHSQAFDNFEEIICLAAIPPTEPIIVSLLRGHTQTQRSHNVRWNPGNKTAHGRPQSDLKSEVGLVTIMKQYDAGV